MKLLSIVLLFCSASAFANAGIPAAVVGHPAVQAIYALLNSANGGLCTAPDPSEVVVICMGALPEVTQPTIAGNGCFFSLTIGCSNGASATVSGIDQTYEIVNPDTPKVTSITPVGIIVENVNIKPAT